jgi:hypothetical protein
LKKIGKNFGSRDSIFLFLAECGFGVRVKPSWRIDEFKDLSTGIVENGKYKKTGHN